MFLSLLRFTQPSEGVGGRRGEGTEGGGVGDEHSNTQYTDEQPIKNDNGSKL